MIFIFLCFAAVYSSDIHQKRLLVNDPTAVQNQLEHLQQEIQNMELRLNSQATTIGSLQSTVSSQQQELSSLKSDVTPNQGVTSSPGTHSVSDARGTHFTIWGSKSCPSNISTVYTGYAGGSWYAHYGGASEYVCMPTDPIWGPHENLTSTTYGFMYGAEYEGNNKFWGMDNLQEDVPCAVCHTSMFSVTIMIPGRTQCYPGWTEAYHGDLASGYYADHGPSQYVCVDEHPEPLLGGGNVNDDGKRFCPVMAECGSLRCPPYKSGKMLSCAVCMQ